MSTENDLNLPPLNLEQTPGTHRLTHLHRNTPGVLATVNRIMAEHGVNIEGQLLNTRGELGYVVTDVPGALSDEVLAALQAMPETVCLRQL